MPDRISDSMIYSQHEWKSQAADPQGSPGDLQQHLENCLLWSRFPIQWESN